MLQNRIIFNKIVVDSEHHDLNLYILRVLKEITCKIQFAVLKCGRMICDYIIYKAWYHVVVIDS